MKRLGLLTASLTLLVLGAGPAPVDKANAPPLPGFPNIKYNASLLEAPLGSDNKPLLKIVRTDYIPDRKVIIWLVELQSDIGFDEYRTIGISWCNLATSRGPAAYFFDKEGVALDFRDLKLYGKLYEGKKGDRIQMVLETANPATFVPATAYLEIRHTEIRPHP